MGGNPNAGIESDPGAVWAGEAAPGEESAMDFFTKMAEEKPTEAAPKSSMEQLADEISEMGKK